MKKSIVFALFVLLTAPLTRAQSRGELERDIAALKGEIARQRPVVDILSRPWHRATDLHFGFAAAPFVAFVQELNTLPEAQRTIRMSVFDHSGQLWGWDASCIGGEEGQFIEFADNNFRVEASARLSNFTAAWVPAQGFRFGLDGAGSLDIGMLHWHVDPCIGGGVGGRAGPASCSASARLSSLTSMTLGNDHILRYASALNLNDIRYGCSISFGDIGDLQIPQFINFPVNVSFSGSLLLPLSTAGVLVSPDPRLPIRKEYDIRLSGTSLQLTNEGVEAGTNVQVVWR